MTGNVSNFPYSSSWRRIGFWHLRGPLCCKQVFKVGGRGDREAAAAAAAADGGGGGWGHLQDPACVSFEFIVGFLSCLRWPVNEFSRSIRECNGRS